MIGCEKFVNKLLPYIRAHLAKKLKEEGLNQKEIAKKLNISQPLVSMYLSKKRGVKDIDSRLKEKIKEIVKSQEEAKVCSICKRIRKVECRK